MRAAPACSWGTFLTNLLKGDEDEPGPGTGRLRPDPASTTHRPCHLDD